jgi:hypothetical protein
VPPTDVTGETTLPLDNSDIAAALGDDLAFALGNAAGDPQ